MTTDFCGQPRHSTSQLTCMNPRAMPLSRRWWNQTKPYSHSRPRSSQLRYSAAFSLDKLTPRAWPGLLPRTGSSVRSGSGDGGSGKARDDGSGGRCLILKENWILPSVKSDVSGKDEKALIGELQHDCNMSPTHSPSRRFPISCRRRGAPRRAHARDQSCTRQSP